MSILVIALTEHGQAKLFGKENLACAKSQTQAEALVALILSTLNLYFLIVPKKKAQ